MSKQATLCRRIEPENICPFDSKVAVSTVPQITRVAAV